MYSAVIDRSDFRQDIAVVAVFYQLSSAAAWAVR